MKDVLAGAWELRAWERPAAPGTVPRAFVGRLVYTRDGWMSVVIHARGRPAKGPANPLDAAPEDAAEAARGAIAYAGRYRTWQEDGAWWVEHEVEAALHPPWAPDSAGRAVRQRRMLRVLSEDEMELSAAPGGTDVTRLRWVRIRDRA